MLEYPLPMPTNLPPRDFILKMFLWTNKEGDFHNTMVFNQVSLAPTGLCHAVCIHLANINSHFPRFHPMCRPSPCSRSPSSWTLSS